MIRRLGKTGILLNVYKPADTTPRAGLNQYCVGTPGKKKTIGVAAVLFGRCWAFNWRKA